MLEAGKQQTLVESLANAVNAIALSRDYRKSQKKDCFDLVRRIKLLLPLFEELRELQGPLPLVAVECFSTLRKTFHSAKRLLQVCHDGSKLYLVLFVSFILFFQPLLYIDSFLGHIIVSWSEVHL